MTRSDGPDEEIWGTREELLLACAVSRHGTESWTSVAMEVQSRIPFPRLLTAQTCERRYHVLRRRFAADFRGIDGGVTRGTAESGAISLLEELRKLRVAELRREVERYDVSIVCLQLKVKRLEEDRERSLHAEQSGDKPDPSETGGVKEEAQSLPRSPGNPAVDRVSGGDSRLSCNESNSTEPKESQDPDGKLDAAAAGAGNDAARANPADGYDEKLAGEGSYNGSSDTVAKGAGAATPADVDPAADPVREPSAGESGESVAESKGEASKESSDVQSSASLSRRRGGRRKAAASGGSSGGDEAEADEVSPVSKESATKSQHLGSFLQVIQSHKYGFMFERRLEDQDSEQYRNLIRQHMDLGMVHSKAEQNAYASDVEFHRDLLLLCTNAVVFFPTHSTEHKAAVQLRELVRKQIPTVTKMQKPVPTSSAGAEEAAAAPPAPAPPLPPPPPPVEAAPRQSVGPKVKSEPDRDSSLLDRPVSAPTLVVCRKRSSISGKAAAKVSAAAKEEEKPDSDKKDLENTEKKRTKDRPAVVGVRGLRTTKARGGVGGGEGVNKNSASNSAPVSTDNVVGTAKFERTNNGGTAAISPAASVAKKRSAVNFLTRMNRGTASSNGSLLQTLKNSGMGGKGAGGDRRKGGRTVGRKDQGPRQGPGAAGSSGKQAQERSVPVKRVGRPPKRPPPPVPSPPAKRAKTVEATAGAASRLAATKKRGRR